MVTDNSLTMLAILQQCDTLHIHHETSCQGHCQAATMATTTLKNSLKLGERERESLTLKWAGKAINSVSNETVRDRYMACTDYKLYMLYHII